jgi:oligoendopeptidase F
MEVEQLEERLGYYAQLRIAENVGDSEANGRFGRLMSVSTKVAALGAYFTPEIQSIPEETMAKFLGGSYPRRLYEFTSIKFYELEALCAIRRRGTNHRSER